MIRNALRTLTAATVAAALLQSAAMAQPASQRPFADARSHAAVANQSVVPLLEAAFRTPVGGGSAGNPPIAKPPVASPPNASPPGANSLHWHPIATDIAA